MTERLPDTLRDVHGDELANLLDWWGLLAKEPAILSTKTGRLQMTYAAVFRDTRQMLPEERAWYLARLDEVYKLLDEDWALDSDWWHEPTTTYLATDWDTLDAPRSDRLVDSLRRLDAEQHPRHTDRLWLTLSWRPSAPTRQLLRQVLVSRGTRPMSRQVRDELALFQEGTARFAAFLKPYMTALAPLGADALCTYLHQCVSWERHSVLCPDPAYDLDWQLTSDLWVPGQPPRLGDHLLQPLTIKTWAPQIRTLVPEALRTLPFPCRYAVGWVPKSTSTADTFLTWAEKAWAGSYRGLSKLLKTGVGMDDATEVEGRDEQDGPINAGQSIINVRRSVRRGESVVGRLSPTVLVWGQSHEDLDERVKAVSEALFQQGLVVRAEGPNASIEWLRMQPGHVKYGIRGRVLETRHLTAVSPHTAHWPGPARDAYLDDAPLLLASSDGAPFNVVTHVGNLGAVLIAGPSQTGKSGFIGLSVRQSARYPRRRGCIFDRDNALKAVTLLSGGHHYALGNPGCARLQPLGGIDTEDEQALRAIWVEQVLTGEGLAPTPEERREILRMIRMLAQLPRSQRTLTLARQLLQVHRLKVGLEPFCAGGEYDFCDGSTDAFAWDQKLLCFEMSGLLNKPRALKAVLSHCFAELEAHWFTGDPVYIWADEFKWLLDISDFLGGVEVMLKARAKKNVSVWASTQELYDMQRTTLWQAILADMPTRILLPNKVALSPDVRPFYDALQVPPWALEALAMAEPFRDYLYTSPLGTKMFQCTLSPVERLLCAASSLEELDVLDHLAGIYPPEELPTAWLRYWNFPAEAALLDPVDAKGDVCSAPGSAPSSPLPFPWSSASVAPSSISA
jgi:hypothetical protein